MRRKSGNVWVERRLIASEAYRALRTATAHRVLMIFFTKRQMTDVGHRGREKWVVTNNDEITFTYREAQVKYGISASVFRCAIDELRDKGFLDIAETGMGLYKCTNKYAVSNRWRLYGTGDYLPPKPRPRGPVNKGFHRGNQHGRNCRKKKSTVVGQHGSTVVVQHGSPEKGKSHVAGVTRL